MTSAPIPSKEPDRFRAPPVTRNSAGEVRKIGFELEFSGLSLDAVVEAVVSALGGEPDEGTAAERAVQVDGLGVFNVELDWAFLKRKATERAEGGDGGEWVEPLSQAAALVVPVEVVCPPVPLTELARLDPVVEALRAAGAKGTEETFLAAYGVHCNAEIATLDAATIAAFTKAFCLLQWWLVKHAEVDLTRRVSPYIDLYPEAYARHVLSVAEPTMEGVLAAYLEHNADRNRALDLLPLLAEVDGERVRRAVDDPRIKARPTFHYRLPNCHIERTDWSLAEAWNSWCVVEELAHRPGWIEELGAAFLDAAKPVVGVSRKTWVERIEQWLCDRELA